MSEKSAEILNNLQSLLTNIMDSKQNNQVLETYRNAANTLKKSYEESGITAEIVDDTMADVKDVIFLLFFFIKNILTFFFVNAGD